MVSRVLEVACFLSVAVRNALRHLFPRSIQYHFVLCTQSPTCSSKLVDWYQKMSVRAVYHTCWSRCPLRCLA
eukprot:2176235-Amphidinium_carterae.1